jgi:hypothetical protein
MAGQTEVATMKAALKITCMYSMCHSNLYCSIPFALHNLASIFYAVVTNINVCNNGIKNGSYVPQCMWIVCYIHQSVARKLNL